ncbi:hypothetical protein TSAR_005209 [Trichomalopsis sarcophagae]|uniref:Uncharacterized protein n=1 Tax=Trichomalopsis sarcophagae TaxID=543379 RepID=A0A232ERN6_9HYME|nr:hypothetical protein TSAR_005209 [Trichomalopsis sarcophagae]
MPMILRVVKIVNGKSSGVEKQRWESISSICSLGGEQPSVSSILALPLEIQSSDHQQLTVLLEFQVDPQTYIHQPQALGTANPFNVPPLNSLLVPASSHPIFKIFDSNPEQTDPDAR